MSNDNAKMLLREIYSEVKKLRLQHQGKEEVLIIMSHNTLDILSTDELSQIEHKEEFDISLFGCYILSVPSASNKGYIVTVDRFFMRNRYVYTCIGNGVLVDQSGLINSNPLYDGENSFFVNVKENVFLSKVINRPSCLHENLNEVVENSRIKGRYKVVSVVSYESIVSSYANIKVDNSLSVSDTSDHNGISEIGTPIKIQSNSVEKMVSVISSLFSSQDDFAVFRAYKYGASEKKLVIVVNYL